MSKFKKNQELLEKFEKLTYNQLLEQNRILREQNKRLREQNKKLKPSKEQLKFNNLNKSISKGKYYSKSINNSLEQFARLAGIGSFKKHRTPPLPKLKYNIPIEAKIKNRLSVLDILNDFNKSFTRYQITLVKARVQEKLERYINEELSPAELRMNLEYLQNYKEQLIKGNRFQKNAQIKELEKWTINQYDIAIAKIKDILSI